MRYVALNQKETQQSTRYVSLEQDGDDVNIFITNSQGQRQIVAWFKGDQLRTHVGNLKELGIGVN